MAYKIELFFQIFSSLLEAMIMIFLWKKIYESSSSGNIGNFSLKEMIIYIILTFTLAKALSSSVDSEVPYEVREGTIAMELIKPYSYILRHLFADLGRVTVGFFSAVIILLSSLFFFHYEVSFINIIFFTLSISIAYVITFAINMIISLVSFYTTYVWGVLMFKSMVISFLSGQLIPLTFFPDTIGKIIRFLPFSYTSFYPIYIFMGKLNLKEIISILAIQIFWAVILIWLMKTLYKKAIIRLQVAGG